MASNANLNSTVAVASVGQETLIPTTGTAQQIAFITQILPYALREAKRTGIPAVVFIIQSGIETGWGTSYLFRVKHNPAGIGAYDSAHGASYPDLSTAFHDYGNKLMGIGEGGQGDFVAGVQRKASVVELLTLLQNSSWAGGHYNHRDLVDTYHSLYGGGSGSNATIGTGTGLSGSTGQDGSTTGVTDVLSGLPIVGGIFDAVSWPGRLAHLVVNLFDNWRYFVEVGAGIVLMLVGLLIIFVDVSNKRAPEVIGAVAKAAA